MNNPNNDYFAMVAWEEEGRRMEAWVGPQTGKGREVGEVVLLRILSPLEYTALYPTMTPSTRWRWWGKHDWRPSQTFLREVVCGG